MIKNRRLSKHIADAAWGEMRQQLAIEAFIERGPVPYKYSTSSHSKKLIDLKSI